jgi:hypothetical protein
MKQTNCHFSRTPLPEDKFVLRLHLEPPIRKPEYKAERKRHLTVCIAAICEHNLIVGASDRMLTAHTVRDVVEFEPARTSTGANFTFKVTPINSTQSIAMMMAGDSDIQAEIVLRMMRFIEALEKQSPRKHWSVEEAVNLYIDFYNQIKARRAASAILAPLNLDSDTFIKRQREMLDSFAETIGRGLMEFPMPGVETIITGIDDFGPHLYVLAGNEPRCCDAIGFSAIGIGASHAELQFMLRGYTRIVPQEEALWLTYMAKRKSEIAPGVGKITDLFRIGGTGKCKYQSLNDLFDKMQLDKIYADFEARQSCAFQEAHETLKRLLEKIVAERKRNPPDQP